MGAWTFVAVADTHVGSPRSFRYWPAADENWNQAVRQMTPLAPDLLLHAGDVARDGNSHRYELDQFRDLLGALPFDSRVVPGNMDTGNKHTDSQDSAFASPDRTGDLELNLTAEQVRQYVDVFGPECWSFVHKQVRFTGLCDMLFGSGLAAEDDQWRRLEAIAAEPHDGHDVWLMHSPLFIHGLHEKNYDIANPAEYLSWYFGIDEPHRGRLMDILRTAGADLVISGHVHRRLSRAVEGIRFDTLPALGAPAQFEDDWPNGDPTPGFMRYDVHDGRIDATFVPLTEVSTATGYGPGGHPPHSARDYSIAREK